MSSSQLPNDTYQPSAPAQSAQRILIVTADDTEDLEFFYPFYRFTEAGYAVDVATPKGKDFKAKHGLGLKETKKIKDVRAEDYLMLYVPGGKAPAALKKDEEAIAITKKFFALGKPIAAICHGPQLLAKAEIITGRKLAAYPEVEDEVNEAGATYINRETITDGPFTTARWPGDLPSHMKEVLSVLSKKAAAPHSHAA